MESLFTNDSTKDLRDKLSNTFKHRKELREEIESCAEYIEVLNRELTKRDKA